MGAAYHSGTISEEHPEEVSTSLSWEQLTFG